MLTLALVILLVVLIIKKPSIVENFASFNATRSRYKDYTNFLCNTRNTKRTITKQPKCISIPLVDQRPQNTHPNSIKPLGFVLY